MNGRFFDKRKIEAFFYDGYTNYNVEETEEAAQMRLKKWQEYLEKQPVD